MASSKKEQRASMREGPLAALFRATDEAGAESAQVHASSRQPDSVAATTPAGRGYPHPGLGAEPVLPADEPPAPSANERLRSAFGASLDARKEGLAPPEPIPAVVAKSPTPAPPVPRSSFAEERLGEPTPWGAAKPVGQPIIRVVGVGGAGVNAVNRMVEAEVTGVEFIAVNTDAQSLQQSTADITLQVGSGLTRGLGAGANPDLGRASAMEDYDKIKSLLKGADLVFIASGAGGGTGTGAAPVVARIAKELGALTVGITTKPFGFEGTRRMAAAESGVLALGEEVDTLIVVPNNRLLSVLDRRTSMVEAFRTADDVLRQGVQGISDLVTLPGLINLDFADVRTIMAEAGSALLGIGMGMGEDRAVQAALRAVESPLLETSMEGARKILLSITSGTDLGLWEVDEAAKAVAQAAHPDANIIFGAMVDERLEDQVWVTVVATGFDKADLRRGAEFKRLEEPRGEPRVQRRTPPREPVGGYRDAAGNPPDRRTRLGVDALDVPEFIPRG